MPEIPEPSRLTLGEIARSIGAALHGDPETPITGVAALDAAREGDLSFVAHPKYLAYVPASRASAFVVPPDLAGVDRPRLVAKNPVLGMARAARLFWAPPRCPEGVHPLAFVAEGAEIGEGARVGPFAHVGPGARIGARARILPGAFVGAGASIGDDSILSPHAVIGDRCVVGARCVIHAGAVIGSDGYGFTPNERGEHEKIPQMGVVLIEDDVEIGANSTIDRATFGATVIRRGVKMDNLVHVAHNCAIGEHSLLVAQVGIAGSTTLGRYVILGGQAGVAGHIKIGDGARAAAKSAIAHSVPAGAEVIGIPAAPREEWFRSYADVRRLPRLKEELKRLSERVARLEKSLEKP